MIEAPIEVPVYAGNGSTYVFDYNFKVEQKTDLLLVVVNADGSRTILVVDVDYTVSGVDNSDSSTWKVHLTVPLATGKALYIFPNLELSQLVNLSTLTAYLPENVMKMSDKLTVVASQLQFQLNRAVKVPIGSAINPDSVVEEIAANAQTASQSASNASQSETNAAASEASASASNSSALTAKNNAESSAAAALVSETNATASEIAAAASASTATTAATTATTKASEASDSATSAVNAATTATTKASEALISATSAAQSASDAASYPIPPWATGQHYIAGKQVRQSGAIYNCETDHDSGVFATDLSAGKWSALSGAIPDASTTVKGIIEIADNTEALAGTDTTRAMTPALVKVVLDTRGSQSLTINGDMRIDQRRAGGSLTTGAGNNNPIDRIMLYDGGGSKFTAQRSTDAPIGFANSLKITSAAATTPSSVQQFNVEQRIEGYNIVDLLFGSASAKSITISFWIKCSLTGNFTTYLMGATGTRAYLRSFTINAANTWEYKSFTVSGETSGAWLLTNGIGLQVGICLGAGSTLTNATANTWLSGNYLKLSGTTDFCATNGATMYVTGLQVERGNVASDFKFQPLDQELIRCERYFEKSYDLNTALGIGVEAGAVIHNVPVLSSGNAILSVRYKVRKRAAPSITCYSPASGTSGYTRNYTSGAEIAVLGTDRAGETGCRVYTVPTNTPVNNTEFAFHYAADAEL